MASLFAWCVGLLAWTFVEYWLHRGWGHRGGSKNPFSVEHLAHHADLSYFAPTYKKIIVALVVGLVMGGSLYYFINSLGLWVTAGFVGMYLYYEFVHRRLHTHRGFTAYGRWARRHHLHHHYRRPQLNHGVTTPLWDYIFGTLEVPRQVKVPRRNALTWMLNEQGELAPGLEIDFVLVGRTAKSITSSQ